MDDDAPVLSSTCSAAVPIFDIPEFPQLRRVKPLPKRRRTNECASSDRSASPVAATASSGSAHATDNSSVVLDAVTDEWAKPLSTTMALQSYYMPIPGGVHGGIGHQGDVDNRHYSPTHFDSLPAGYSDIGILGDDIEQGDGDSTDHLHQPKNTKKRKVPVNASSRIGDTNSASSGEEDTSHRFIAIGRRDDTELADDVPPSSLQASSFALNRGKLSRATNAALKHKELLKARKKQFASVLGSIPHGDTLALDQALSTSYPLARILQKRQIQGTKTPVIRLSRRPARRRARLALMALIKGHIETSSNVSPASWPSRTTPSCGSDDAGVFGGDFTYECASPMSERLRVTIDEVAVLHAKFETELRRQEAETERHAALLVNQMSKAKRGERTKQRARTTAVNDGTHGSISGTFGNSDRSLLTSSKPPNTKKKRSALANASNPHHLRNYVPSRIPQSGILHPAQAVINAQNLLGPLPIRFLSAQLPPRRPTKTNVSPVTQLSNLVQPEEEWVCAFCEYSLFYGDDRAYHQAIRNRKKVLSRRRRALERAAAAASGRKRNPVTTEKEALDDEIADGEDFENPGSSIALKPRSSRTKAEQERDRDKDSSNDMGVQLASAG